MLIISVVAQVWFHSQIFSAMESLRLKDEILKYLALLPGAGAVWVFSEGRKLLFPEENTKGQLQKWPDYWRLRVSFEIALIYAVLFAMAGLTSWALDWRGGSLAYVLLFGSLSGGLCAVATVFRAMQTVKEILAQAQ